MSRDVPDVVAFALVVVVTVSAVALPASALGGATATATVTTADGGVAPQTTNGSANGSETLAPGQRLAGVVGVQGAEIDGELEERTLATRVDRAESNTSKAAVVATELNTARERLRNLRETQTALREARRSGDISTGEYRARMAITAAQIRSVRTKLDSSEAVTRDLPDAALEARGVNREEIDRLREDADELRGPEVAEIARQVAGDDEDDRENAERTGPPEDAGNGDGNAERTGPPEDAGNGDGNAERTGPPEDTGNGDGNAGAGNRSETAGPPDEARNGEEDDSEDGPGNSDDAGNSGDSPGNSDDAGNGDGVEDDGSDDGPGNSDDAGNGDDSDANGDGSDDSPGNSDDAGNGDDSDANGDGSDDSSGNADGAGNDDDSDDSPGNSGDAGDGDGSDGAGNDDDSPGNSGGRSGGNR
ncbi:hypothetical protein DU500_01480 [Haloplanus rubicundus]|uniref:Uncharacterized protein n=1 Tax=Haloplanus rubicundus TaxID=1547898 RepID=A0A345DZ29_9EURY|nr:hypothetical protein [Haloplanus rubicundus]AXG05201.1 hypothetical protein DU500_01480 [Haloplanus rubicundus]